MFRLVLVTWAAWLFCVYACLPTDSIKTMISDPVNASDDLDHVTIEGVVTDAGGNHIVNARVIARQMNTGNERSMTTGQDGRYRFTTLTPGVYELRVESAGFQTARYEKTEVVAGATIRRDFMLSPAAIEAQIIIDAGADPTSIDITRTVVGGTVTRQQIDRLPTESRNPLDLIYTLPGTSPPALSEKDLAEGDRASNFRRTPEESGIFSLTGGAPFSNNITIEGLDNNDDRSARERFIPSTHAVEEAQIITNQFSAEYGRASGGRVNLRLRGGTNQLHGHGFYYFRDESLNANPFTRNADPLRGKRIPFQNRNPGGSVGGPIVPGKIFYFFAYENDYVYDRADITALLPVDTNPAFPLPKPNGANLGSASKDKNGKTVIVNDGASVGLYDRQITTPSVAHSFQSRVDFKLGARHDSFALLTFARNRDERGFPGGRRTLDTIRRTGRDSQSYAIADTFILSPRLVNSARFQFSRLAPADAPPSDNPVVIIDIDDPRDAIGDSDANPLTRRGSLTAGSSNLGGVDRRENRYQGQESLNYISGPHTLRVGADLQNIRSRFVDLSDATGTFTFGSVAAFLAGAPSRYQHRFFTDSELRNTYMGIFAQDDWRLRQNLTVSAGLRWDNETILDDRNNFGPRISFAWDPFNQTRTVVRGGYGLFYNRAMLRTLDDFILTSNATLIDTNNTAAERLLAELKFPQVLSADDSRVRQLGAREAGFLRHLGKDFRIPESHQVSLGFERELSRGFKLEMNYVFNRGQRLWREINANAPRLPSGFNTFTDYLLTRDFDNLRDPGTGQRPITNTGNADLVRFNRSAQPTQTIRDGTRTIVVFGLDNPSTSNAAAGTKAALAVVRQFRPDPSLTQIEELQSRGVSIYHGASVELYRRLTARGFLRASYTLSRLVDDGVVNTSSPLVVGDFGRERALSLLDARHRIAVSGYYGFPNWLLRLNLSGVFNFASSRPFSIGANGNDRNLDDVNNDRPNFTGDLKSIHWRRPGEALDQSLTALARGFTLPTIGSVGNLPRNIGRGPNTYTLNLRLSREFRFGEHRKAELLVEAFNPFNSTVFNFGAEFVDFTPSGLGNFLVPQRTVKPRTMRVGAKVDF